MKQLWKVFIDTSTGKELAAYTVKGTFPGEEQNTIELLAAEKGLDPEQIATRIEKR